jgi:hypothetical protein
MSKSGKTDSIQQMDGYIAPPSSPICSRDINPNDEKFRRELAEMEKLTWAPKTPRRIVTYRREQNQNFTEAELARSNSEPASKWTR